ncbi:toll/interleukin-1 receptor domain-containing protein [Corallococcus carmarthensis]|uniref:Toll/interleukin-1 receptor domain-containing protein n=1 Tax=Corallococcus carmarthensis TaxID=2316728 RepID=A0A3A8KJY6_9BACT|nr:toll/interleukin-1 receptor domain-containing protein [Corallococcus carmarthensis]NOK15823.1 toll/interleukin-1 receptor domain-containing protein [Corallococcus carmarthensis]RKH07449.1 toll/interleukin-1 receptor domain-containing protein [Corallococcus carmarthensis]
MATIFLSYAREDERKVARLEEALRRANHTVWWDRTGLRAGEPFPSRIGQEIARAEFVVVCLSRGACESRWVEREVDLALQRQLAGRDCRVIPVRLENVALLPALRACHAVDVFPEGHWERGVQELLRAVAEPGTQVPPTPLPVTSLAAPTDPVQALVRGITELPEDLAHRIESFLRHYVGAPSRRAAPFGGRAGELSALDTWLASGTEAPYRLLLAPGGQGKSALLAQWVSRLAARSDVAVAYMPVSVRFQTNLAGAILSALGARLAFLHGEAVPSRRDMTLETWRRLISDALTRPLKDGRPLLVLLDGIDEAADLDLGPALFPQAPLPGLRVLLSARQMVARDAVWWRQELGWERARLASVSGLEHLDRDGVEEAIEQLGPPLGDFARDSARVDELYRLTEGAPLVLSLYLAEWEEQGRPVHEPAGMGTLHPGLTGYFERWWSEQLKLWGAQAAQHERAVWNLLGLLACALGPMRRDEVLKLLRADTDLELVEMLRPLARFIIGNGRDQGYTFTHPGLGTYFAGQLSTGDRRRWKERFLEWGEESLRGLATGDVTPAEVPPYLFQYLGAHLEEARSGASTMLRLVSDEWRRAVEARDSTLASFLTDLERASRAVQREAELAARRGATSAVADEIRCAMARASVHTLAQDIPPLLLRRLVQHGEWTLSQCRAYARQIPDVVGRVTALIALGKACPGEEEECLREAIEHTFRAPEDTLEYALRELAPHLSPKLAAQVIDTARQLRPASFRARVLAFLANHQPEANKDELVKEVVSFAAAARQNTKQLILGELSPDLRLHHGITEIESHGSHVPLDLGLALNQLLGDEDAMREGQRALHEAWKRHAVEPAKLPGAPARSDLPRLTKAAFAIPNEFARGTAIESLAPFLEQDSIDEAVRAVDRLPTPHVQARVLASLAERTPAPGRQERLHQALALARKVQDSWALVDACIGIAARLPFPTRKPVLVELGTRLRSEQPHWHRLMARLASVCEEPMRTGFLDEALAAANVRGLIFDWRGVFRVLGEAAGHPRVWETLGHLVAERRRDILNDTLDLLVPFIPEAFFQDALEAMFVHTQGWLARGGLRELAPRLPPESQRWVLDTSSHASRPGELVETLVALLPSLERHLLPQARDLVARCTGSGRAVVLGALLPRLSISEREPVLWEAFELLRSESPTDMDIAEFLRLVTPLLPDVLAEEAISVAQSMNTGDLQTEALASLVVRFPGRPDVLTGALSGCLQYSLVWTEEPLLKIAPHIPVDLLPMLFQLAREQPEPEARAVVLGTLAKMGNSARHIEALEEAFREACHAASRQSAFHLLAPELRRLPREQLRRLWAEMLPTLSARPRRELLSDLEALAPVLLFLGGEQELVRTIHTILDVGTWWS